MVPGVRGDHALDAGGLWLGVSERTIDQGGGAKIARPRVFVSSDGGLWRGTTPE
jgi:hypothetical protein